MVFLYRRLFPLLLAAFFLPFAAFAYEGMELGYIDAVTVNDAHFEDLDRNEIVFYPEDLRNGEVIFRGLLESENRKVPVESLGVEITLDGGRSWQAATGHGKWEFRFRPELEKTYAFGVRVVERTPQAEEVLQGVRDFEMAMGPFILRGIAESGEEGLRGVGVLDLGFLNSLLPSENGKRPGLEVSFSGLKPDPSLRRIVAGRIDASVNLNVSPMEGALFRIRSMQFTPEGGKMTGALGLSLDGVSIPTLPFRDLTFTPQGMAGRIAYRARSPQKIPLITGEYGASLMLKALALDFDTQKKRLALSDVDASLVFSETFGDLSAQKVAYGNGIWRWGKEAGEAAGRLTLPGTAVKISDLGGSIEKGLKGIVLSGRMQIPVLDSALELNLEGPSALRLTASGLSTQGRISLDKLDTGFDLGGFAARVKSLSLTIRNNRVSGTLTAGLTLEALRNASLDIRADIRDTGLHNLETQAGPFVLPIPGFATLHLEKTRLTLGGRNGVSIDLDGFLEVTHPGLKQLVADTNRDLSKEGAAYFNRLGGGLQGQNLTDLRKDAGDLKQEARTGLGKAGQKGREALGQAEGKGRQLASAGRDFVFSNLRIFKDRLELPTASAGWQNFSTPMKASLDGFSLSAESWGLGVAGGVLWAGLKGSATVQQPAFSSQAKATAQFYLDGRFEVMDFAANASLEMGAFILHTDASLSGGRISGRGTLISKVPIPSLPDLLKNAEDRLQLDVLFTNLEAAGGKILSGVIDLPLPEGLEISLPLASIELKALHVSPHAALADASVRLKGFPGMEAIAFHGLSLGENGFSASGNVAPETPLVWTLFDSPQDITLTLRSFAFHVDTGAGQFSLSDLDAGLALGSAYGGLSFPLGFQNEAFSWGSLAGMVPEAPGSASLKGAAGRVREGAGQVQAEARRFVIPGTEVTLENPGGTLRPGLSPSLTLSGVLRIPGFSEPFEIPIPDETPLVISRSGISTQAEILLTEGLKQLPLEGFPLLPERIALSLADNVLDLGLSGSLILEKFGGIALAVDADFNGFGLDRLRVNLDRMQTRVSLEGFADLDLQRIATGFNEKGLFVDLDCDLTLTHPMLQSFTSVSGEDLRDTAASTVAGLGAEGRDQAEAAGEKVAAAARPMALRGLQIYKDALSFGKGLAGWHALSPAAMARIQDVDLLLKQWGLGAEGSRFWVGFQGAMALQAQNADTEAQATAQFYSDGTFRLLDMNFAGEFQIGPFRLLTDAQYSEGRLTGSGVVVSDQPMPRLPAFLKDEAGYLKVAVDFADLVVDAAAKRVTGGLIALDTAFDLSAPLTEAQAMVMAVRRLGFSPQGMLVSGAVDLPPLFGGLELPTLEVTDLQMGLEGFSGITRLGADWDSPVRIGILETLGVDILLSGIVLSIDWSRPGLSKVSLTDLSGSLDTGRLFATLEEAARPALLFAEGALRFTLPEASLPGMPDLGLKDLQGRILLGASGVQLTLDALSLSMNVLDTEVRVGGSGMRVDSTGLSGEFSLNTPLTLSTQGYGGRLKTFSLRLEQNRVAAGSLGLDLNLERFFNLEFAMEGILSASGLDSLRLASNASIPPITRFQELAILNIQDLSASYSKEAGLSLSMYPEVQFTHTMLKDMETVRLNALRISKDAVDFSGLTLRQQPDNMKLPMGPLTVAITDLGLTLSSSSISTTISGSAELGDLARGAVTITASPSSFSINRIALTYNQYGVRIGGGLEWDGAASRFAADANLSIAGVMSGAAEMELGRNTQASPAYTWWRVGFSASMGAPIPLSPIPLSIYAFNGGVAYHMKAVSSGGQVSFIPDASVPFVCQAGLTLGTAGDMGYTWHGDMMLTLQPGAPILFSGDTYFLKENLGTTEKRYLRATITIGVSQPYFSLVGNAKFLIDEASLDILDVRANCSIQFGPTSRDWHIYIGTKENPVSVKAIAGFFTGDGYLMMDSNGMKFGFSQSFDLSASAACFYGRLYGGVAMDFVASIRPFYVDAEGRVWIGIEAGVKAFGERYAIIEAYASLEMKFRTPNPTYMRIKAKFRYSFCAGLVSGTYRMTFWIPEKPDSAEIDDPTRFPLVGNLLPSEGATDIPRSMAFELSTTLPVDEIFILDNGKRYMLRLLDVRNNPSYRSGAVTGFADYIDMGSGTDGVNALALRNKATGQDIPRPIGGVDDKDTIKIRSFDELGRKTAYALYARAHLLEVKGSVRPQDPWRGRSAAEVFAGVAYDEGIRVANFTTVDAPSLSGAREIIEKVYPGPSDEVVFPDTEVRIYYRVPASGQTFATTNRHYVVDATGESVVGPEAWLQGLTTANTIAATQQWVKFVKPTAPLTGQMYFRDEMTGEVRPALVIMGHEHNPFTGEECWRQDCSDQARNLGTGAAMGSAGSSAASSGGGSGPSGASSPYSLATGGGYTLTTGGPLSATQPSQAGLSPQQSAAAGAAYRYSRYRSGAYAIEVLDAEGRRIYRSPFEVSAQALSNAQVIQESQDAQNLTADDFYNWTPEVGDINPLHVSMHLSGSAWGGQVETELIFWNEAHQQKRSAIDWKYHSSGYGSCPRNQALSFDALMAYCPAALLEYELWLMTNPRPVPVSSHGAPGDLIFTFETTAPLNWDGTGLSFEIQKKGNYPSIQNSLLTLRLGRRDYEVISAPTATKHLILIPKEKIVYAGTQNHSFQYDHDYHKAVVRMQAVRTVAGADGTYDTRVQGESIFNWTLTYKRDVIDHIPQSCNGNHYTGIHCTPAQTIFSAPYFAIYHYDYHHGVIAQ